MNFKQKHNNKRHNEESIPFEILLNSLNNKQYILPKSFFNKMDICEIEDNEKYNEFLKNEEFFQEKPKKILKKEESIQTFSPTYKSLYELLGPVYTTHVDEKSNKSLHYRFLDSIFHILINDFWRKEKHEKHNFFIQYAKKLNSDFSEKELYYHFNYSKNRKMKRENIIKVLNQVLIEKCEYEIFHTFIQYCFDVLNVSGVILHMKNGNIDFEKSEIYHYKNIYNPLNPLVILYYDNGIYYPVLRDDKEISIFNMCEDDDYEIVNNIYKYMKYKPIDVYIKDLHQNQNQNEQSNDVKENVPINFDFFDNLHKKENIIENNTLMESMKEESNKKEIVKEKKYKIVLLEKMKLDELKELCEKENISTKKKSEKTNNSINKIKIELITDLLEVYV